MEVGATFRGCLRLLSLSALFLVGTAAGSHGQIRPSPIGTIDGLVTSVSDGGHLTVSNGGAEIDARLYGIEAPIITKIRRNEAGSKPGQRFAGKAFMALAKKVLHKHARLEVMHVDQNHEAVVVVYVDGRNINLEMIAEGWAWASQKTRKPPADAEYLLAEEGARAKKAGLWVQENPQPPWDFRKARKVESKDGW